MTTRTVGARLPWLSGTPHRPEHPYRWRGTPGWDPAALGADAAKRKQQGARERPCRVCGAVPGEPCTRGRGRKARALVSTHDGR